MITTVQISGTSPYTLERIAVGLTDRRPLNAQVGNRGERELREHFRERNQEPNKRGWPKQDFWNRIRKATALAGVDASGATIAISDPAITQKIHGGEIKPKEGKYLALPAIAEAYGKSPRSFNNLEPMIRWMNGERRAVALMERKSTDVKSRTESGGKVFYWLVESVHQKKDERALPGRAKMEAALAEEAGFFLEDLRR